MSLHSPAIRFSRGAGLALAAGATLFALAGQLAYAQSSGGRTFGDLRGFDGVTLAGSDTVIVTRGAGFSVRAEGDPKAIDQLDIFVRGRDLHVERKKRRWGGWFSSSDKGATVRVTLPLLRRAVLAGSGDMRVDLMRGRTVEAKLAGSGNLGIRRIEAQSAIFDLASSGDLNAAGRVGKSMVSMAGSGDVHADRLAADNISVSLVGSGNAYLRASRAATISIVGSGDVTIKGTRNCRVSKLGAGDARCTL